MTHDRAILLVTMFSIAVSACAGEPAQTLPAAGSSLGMEPGRRPPDAILQVPTIGIADDPVLGSAGAPVTLVEFIDYECPYCQGFAKDVFPQLKANYIDTGKVRYIARDFPLARHGRARPAAIAAACARDQGRFWEMHDALLETGHLTEADLAARAKKLALDVAKFDACRADPRHDLRLDEDFAAARALGVRGTPSFLVGASRPGAAQGRLLQGDENYAAFEQILNEYLAIDSQRD